MTVLITLTDAGADTGPFNLYSNIDGFTVAFETNVPKASLEAGYISILVPDTTSTIRVTSMNPTCSNSVDLLITGTTTTTTSSTSSTSTTTTLAPCLEATIGVDNTLSLNIPIAGVEINGVPVTYVSGQNFPIPAGFQGIFTSNQIGNFTIDVFYGAGIAGQKITVIDSVSTSTCTNLGIGGGTVSVPTSEVNCDSPVLIIGEDGTC